MVRDSVRPRGPFGRSMQDSVFRHGSAAFLLGGAHAFGMGKFGRTDAESRIPYCSVFLFSGAEWMLLLRNRQDVRRGRPRFLAV